MKAFLIARVSTADQVDALPAQIYRLTDYARKHDYDYELFQFHESAYKGVREKFRAVIERIYQSEIPIIVVFDKVDRFTRDSSAEETAIFKKLYLSGKIEIHIPSENLFLHQNSPSTDKMRLGLNTIFAEYYSDAISDNVRRRNQQLWRDGIWTSAAPFGYKNITLSDGKKWIELVPLRAQAVKRAYELYATGSYSLLLIRKKIFDEYGFKLTCQQWHKILRNPFYYGTMRIKGVLYPHVYDKVISEELFDKVKAVMDGYAISPKRWAGLPYPYRGLILCAECGCRVTFEQKKGKYIYGHCTQYNGKHGACYINENEITKQLKSVFLQIQLPEHAREQVANALMAEDEISSKKSKEKLSQIEAEINRVEDRIQRNYDAYIDGLASKETYLHKDEELKQKKKALEKTRNNIELMSNNTIDGVISLLDLSQRAPEIFENAENDEKRELINKVLSNLELGDKELRWKLKKPYDTMAFCNKTQNWLGIRPTVGTPF